MFLHTVHEADADAAEGAIDGAFGALDLLGDLFDFEVLKVAELDELAVFGGEFGEAEAECFVASGGLLGEF